MTTLPRRRLLPALILAIGAPSGAVAQQAEAFVAQSLVPDSVLAPPGMPRIVRLPGSVPGVVSLRLSIPVDERPLEAGAGRVLESIARTRMEGAAVALGARVETGRTPWGLVYTVSGPVADLDYLVYLLREGTRPPETDRAAIATARQDLSEQLHRLEETGGGRVEATLRTEASGGRAPLDGTPATVPSLGAAALQDVWARTHRPDAMTLLVLGDVADPVLLATLTGLGAGPEVSPPVAPEGAAPPTSRSGRVETLRHWYGAAWVSSAPLDPRAAVVSVLLARRLREERDTYEAEVRLWETPDRTVLAVVGAAYPRQAAALQRRLNGLLEATAADLAPGEVQEVAERARRDLLLQARTPWGRVHFVGRFLDAGGSLDGAAAYLDALASTDDAAVREFLAELASSQRFTAEVRP